MTLERKPAIPYFHRMSELTDDIVRIFSESGVLATTDAFEYRSQQEAMALAIAGALEGRTHLMVEAPTGVGKTLAYLVPSILYATRNHRRAIISTHTRNLQDQLFRKDIPIVRTLIGSGFRAELLKGRGNYLCTTRLRNALAAPGSLFRDEAAEQLGQLYRWSASTADGDIDTLPFAPLPEVWDLVCSERGLCSPGVCGSDCFFQRARERVRSADLVILNHALFFALVAVQENEERFIFDDDFVVFDEAHTLPTVAGAGVGTKVSRHQVLTTLHRLYNPRTKRGLLSRPGKRLSSMIAGLDDSVTEFFATVSQAARSLAAGAGPQATALRIRTRGFVVNSLAGPLTELCAEIEKIAGAPKHAHLRAELDAVRQSCLDMLSLIDNFLEQPEPAFTYWVELSRQGGGNVSLCASPSEVGDIIGPRLFKEGTSVIMTSATLAVGDSMAYAQQRIGATNVPALILDSPFDHMRQMRLCLAGDMPEPETDGYAGELPSWILRSVERSEGKALVLFTSAALMNSMASVLMEPLNELGLRLFVQGTEMSRHDMLGAFRDDVHSVLFGLDSFWMGVDVPGEALEHVIITRLPFAVPNHPLIEARLESIARRGGQAFLEFTLPEAVLKFRQGAGRLIRTRTDRGMVTVLDSRIVRRSYGRVFLSSIPRCPVEILAESGASEELSQGEW